MSDDLIRRSDAIKAYNEAMSELVKWQMEEWQLGDFSECEFNTTDCKHIVRKIEAIPSADRPQGKWVNVKISISGDSNAINFCPNCGADMRGKNVLAVIDDAPSIDIVFCKECKWAKANGTYQWCGRLDSTARITADDYCSYGEREGE